MGWLARAVVIILGLMSAWSIGVMIDRSLVLQSARKQSREFAPAVAGCLKEGKVEEAISVAEQNKRSHLAKVVEAGSAGIPSSRHFSRTRRRADRIFPPRLRTR